MIEQYETSNDYQMLYLLSHRHGVICMFREEAINNTVLCQTKKEGKGIKIMQGVREFFMADTEDDFILKCETLGLVFIDPHTEKEREAYFRGWHHGNSYRLAINTK